ncbi:hypothetical protein WMW72_04815 [Paenibacillus filicis]|uniref:Uncharacterized protein n=1 Tax=Paenibacillus filicis TaxID=669464 RepID=A0ABU9DGM3_9BACL
MIHPLSVTLDRPIHGVKLLFERIDPSRIREEVSILEQRRV